MGVNISPTYKAQYSNTPTTQVASDDGSNFSSYYSRVKNQSQARSKNKKFIKEGEYIIKTGKGAFSSQGGSIRESKSIKLEDGPTYYNHLDDSYKPNHEQNEISSELGHNISRFSTKRETQSF
jgi:hypothetical protein